MATSQSHPKPIDPKGLTACPECDLLVQKMTPKSGVRGLCPRCRCVLFHTKKDSIEQTLTLSLAGLILFVPAMVLPIMTLNAMGIERTSNILQGIMTLFLDDFHLVAILVLLTAVIVPFLKLLLLFYVSISVRFMVNLGNPALAFRFYKRLDEWGMLEVYMLGILVSITKLTDLAQVSYDVGLFCFVFLLIITLFSSVTLDKQQYWSLIGQNANTRNG